MFDFFELENIIINFFELFKVDHKLFKHTRRYTKSHISYQILVIREMKNISYKSIS